MRILLGPTFVATLFLSACGSTDTEVGGESGYSAFVDELASLICQAGASCCNDPTFPFLSCEFSIAYLNTHAEGTYTFDQRAADQCLAAVRADRCFVDLPDICSLVAIGLTAPGEVCQTSSECAPPVAVGSDGPAKGQPPFQVGGVCDSLFDDVGHCRQAVGLGEACDGTCMALNDCQYTGDDGGFRFCYVSQGVYCGTSGSCEALVPSGGACAGSEECATGLLCLDDSTCGAARAGASCALGLLCSAGNYCDGARVCAPQLPLGATCSLDDWCQSFYCKYSGTVDEDSGNCAPGSYACFFDGLH